MTISADRIGPNGTIRGAVNKKDGGQFWSAFGPGLLFAGTAIGLSHLVQSTRAGALYGLGLAGVIVLIHIVKYPMFRFGAYYAITAKESLVEGYRRQGWYAVLLLLAVMLSYMFFALGGVGMLAAALIQTVVGFEVDTILFAGGILLGCALLLMIGQYRWLDRVNKGLVAVLAVSTLAAAAISLPHVEWTLWPENAAPADLKLILFIAALGGFMPISADSSVWQSLWTLAKGKDSKRTLGRSYILIDFNIGYWGSAIFALCFVIMGAAVMQGAGIEPEAEAVPFAAQLISLYDSALASWAVPLVGASVISVILTTTLAGLDALTRMLVAITRVLRNRPVVAGEEMPIDGSGLYRAYVLMLAGGAMAVILFMSSSFRAFLDVGTTIGFLVAPVIAIFNHRAVFGPAVPLERQPARAMRAWSLAGIVVLGAFTAGYLYLLAGGYLD